MVYKEASQKVLITLTIILIFITSIVGWDYFYYWMPIAAIFGILYIIGKYHPKIGASPSLRTSLIVTFYRYHVL